MVSTGHTLERETSAAELAYGSDSPRLTWFSTQVKPWSDWCSPWVGLLFLEI